MITRSVAHQWSKSKKWTSVLLWAGQSPDLDSRPVITHLQLNRIQRGASSRIICSVFLFPSALHLALSTWHRTRGSYQKKTIPSIHWDLQHIWHPIYLKHLLSRVNDPTKGPASEGWVGVQHSGETQRLNLTSGPRSCNKFWASCPNRSGFSCSKHLIHLLNFCSCSPPHVCLRRFYSETRAAWHWSHLWRPSIFKGECR